jgi:glycine oxidase
MTSTNDPADRADVVVVGAGLIGLGIAWRAAARGLDVIVVDPAPGAGASGAAAGMLAPVSELHYGEDALLALNLISAGRYGDWSKELTEATGTDIGYRECGTVVTAWDGADLTALRDLQALHERLGLHSRMLGRRELRELEPGLAAGLPGGLLAAEDHQVDPQALHAALTSAAGAAGVRLRRRRARRVQLSDVSGDRVTGVELDSGEVLAAGQVVLAGGARIRELDGLPPSVAALAGMVRPVKGQTLHLRADRPGLLTRVVRGSVRGVPVYLVPRDDGRVVVGASSEEAGFDTRPRAGAVYELLRDAQALVPEIGELMLERVATGLRPGSPDNAPVIGPAGPEGLVVAGGHFRNGVLLAPVTAEGVAGLLTEGELPAHLIPFSPQRFTSTKGAAG